MSLSDQEKLTESKGSRLIKAAVKAFISLCLIAFIFRQVDGQKVWQSMLSAQIEYLLIALLFQLMSLLIAAFRWRIIMTALDFKESLLFYVKSYFKGTFFNQILPTSVGGDAYRILELGSRGYSKRESLYGVFVDRVAGLFGLLLLNLIANNISDSLLPADMKLLINMITLGGLIGIVALTLIRKISIFAKIKWLQAFHDLSVRFRTVYRTKSLILAQIGLSVVVHFFSLLAIFCIGIALKLDFPLLVIMTIVPPVILLTLLPISLAGWGVREGAMVGLFLLIGAEKAGVLSMSLLYGLLLIVISFPGLYYYIRSPNRVF